MNCSFCDTKNISVRIIYKDDLVMAFPTNIPITPGHTLVCPTRHLSKINELSDEEIVALKNFIIKLKEAMIKSLGAEGFNIAWNEGETAGQAIDHLHIHIVPRQKGDTGIYEYDPRKFLYRPGSRKESPNEELADVAKLINKNLE
ncbi:MAG: HIT family protein [Patescibacteria group bacterium]